jgi:hypothetical protein
MKAKQTIGGSLLFAALASYALSVVRHRTATQRKLEEERFEECALTTFEGEGGLVVS